MGPVSPSGQSFHPSMSLSFPLSLSHSLYHYSFSPLPLSLPLSFTSSNFLSFSLSHSHTNLRTFISTRTKKLSTLFYFLLYRCWFSIETRYPQILGASSLSLLMHRTFRPMGKIRHILDLFTFSLSLSHTHTHIETHTRTHDLNFFLHQFYSIWFPRSFRPILFIHQPETTDKFETYFWKTPPYTQRWRFRLTFFQFRLRGSNVFVLEKLRKSSLTISFFIGT